MHDSSSCLSTTTEDHVLCHPVTDLPGPNVFSCTIQRLRFVLHLQHFSIVSLSAQYGTQDSPSRYEKTS